MVFLWEPVELDDRHHKAWECTALSGVHLAVEGTDPSGRKRTGAVRL